MPPKFGDEFVGPSKKVFRRHKAAGVKRLFSKEELIKLLAAAKQEDSADVLVAMILLGVNCGFGNTDCSLLEFSHLQEREGFVCQLRSKTYIARTVPLWPETHIAIKNAIELRPSPKHQDYKQRVLLTKQGNAWGRTSIATAFRRIATRAGVYTPGRTFYALRHTFETVGGAARDQVAVNHIMGHSDNTMADVYREEIQDNRLFAVTNHVRHWLYEDTSVQGMETSEN